MHTHMRLGCGTGPSQQDAPWAEASHPLASMVKAAIRAAAMLGLWRCVLHGGCAGSRCRDGSGCTWLRVCP